MQHFPKFKLGKMEYNILKGILKLDLVHWRTLMEFEISHYTCEIIPTGRNPVTHFPQ